MTNYEQNLSAGWQEIAERLNSAEATTMPDDLLHLVRAVAGVDDSVMRCEEHQAWLPTYVDAEMGGLSAARRYPEVKRHLDLCSDCMAEYLQMLEWAVEEETIQPMPAAAMPKPNLSFLPPIEPAAPAMSLLEVVRSLSDTLFEALGAKRLKEYQSIGEMFFKRLTLAGENFVFHPTPVLSSGANTMQYLVVIYSSTQKLAQQWSALDIERESRRGTLLDSLRQQAEQEAVRQGFRKEEAQRFAEQYAQLVSQKPTILQSLVNNEGS